MHSIQNAPIKEQGGGVSRSTIPKAPLSRDTRNPNYKQNIAPAAQQTNEAAALAADTEMKQGQGRGTQSKSEQGWGSWLLEKAGNAVSAVGGVVNDYIVQPVKNTAIVVYDNIVKPVYNNVIKPAYDVTIGPIVNTVWSAGKSAASAVYSVGSSLLAPVTRAAQNVFSSASHSDHLETFNSFDGKSANDHIFASSRDRQPESSAFQHCSSEKGFYRSPSAEEAACGQSSSSALAQTFNPVVGEISLDAINNPYAHQFKGSALELAAAVRRVQAEGARDRNKEVTAGRTERDDEELKSRPLS